LVEGTARDGLREPGVGDCAAWRTATREEEGAAGGDRGGRRQAAAGKIRGAGRCGGDDPATTDRADSRALYSG
jgi:hypothetical protein